MRTILGYSGMERIKVRAIRWILGLAISASLLCGPSCNSGSNDDNGFVRFIQMSPDAGRVDLLLAGLPTVFNDIAFEENAGNFDLSEDDYVIDVVPHGKTASDALINVDVSVVKETTQTIVTYDHVQSIKQLVLNDDFSTVPTGKFRFRVIHVASAFGQVDVFDVTNPSSPKQLYDNLTFGTAGDYIEVDAGTYDLGFDTNGDQTVDITFPLPQIDANTILNIFFVTNSNNEPQLVLENSNNETTELDPD